MTQKAEEKFKILWTSFKEARAARTSLDDVPWTSTSEAWATFVLTEEGAETASAHLDAMSRERRAFKRLLRHSKRHGAEMLEAPAETEPAKPPQQKTRPERASRAPSAAKAVGAKAAESGPKPSAQSAAARAKASGPAAASPVRASSLKPSAQKTAAAKQPRRTKAATGPAVAPKGVSAPAKTSAKAAGAPKKPAAAVPSRPVARRRPGSASSRS
jgi:hypothetical protein